MGLRYRKNIRTEGRVFFITTTIVDFYPVFQNDSYYQILLHSLSFLKEKYQFKIWMDRFDDLVIYNPEILKIKMDYIHQNPVRKGLVKEICDWSYSSARNYYLEDHSVFPVDTEVLSVGR